MADYSQMVAIPRHEYTQLTTIQNARQPLTEQFYKLENNYQANALIPDAQRSVSLQSQTIEHMKSLKDQMRHYLSVSTPKPYRTRAESLFQSLEPYLNVNELGELIKDDGSIIKSSRFEDLIQHAVRDRRRQFSPTGWDHFVSMIKKYNVPRSVLNRDTLDELDSPIKMTNTPQPSKIPRPISKSPKRLNPSKKKGRIQSPSTTKQTRGRNFGRRSPSAREKAPPRRYMFELY